MPSRSSFLVRALISIGSVVAAAGCAGADASDAEPEAEDLSVLPHVARVRANGLGCPRTGTTSSISADGASVTVDFSSFTASMPAGTGIGTADCTLLLGVDGWQGYQYTLDSFEVDGAARISGAPETVQQTLAYGFSGSGPIGGKYTLDLTTPSALSEDGSYSFRGVNDPAHASWSPCTANRDLEVQTRVTLGNDAHRAAQVSVEPSHLKLSLRYRKC